MTAPLLGMGMDANDPVGALARRFESLQTQITELRAAQTLNAATIGKGGLSVQGGKILIKDSSGNVLLTLDADGLTVANDGTITVDGELAVSGSQTVSGSLAVSGNETVSGKLHVTGDTVIDGTLSLPNASVNNSALANPVEVATFASEAITSLSFTTQMTTYVVKSIAVPSGFSQACAYACTVASDTDGGGTDTFLSAVTRINGTDGPANIANFTSGGGSVAAPCSRLLTGLDGGDITIEARAARDGITGPACTAILSGFAIFLR